MKAIILLLKIVICMVIACFIMGCPDFEGSAEQEGNLSGTIVSSPVNGIAFKSHSTLNNYGFDVLSTSPTAYISIASGNQSTHFIVQVKDNPNGAKSISQNTAFVDVTGGVDLTNATDNDVTLKSGIAGGTQININSCSNETVPDSCYVKTENAINVKVYDPRVIKLKVSLLNETSYNATNLKSTIDSYIKQGCLVTNSFTPTEYKYFDQSGYDKNNNGIFDKWITEPYPSQDEFADLKLITNTTMWSTGNPGIIIVKNKIRLHWELSAPVPKDFSMIGITGKGKYFKEGDVATIGPLPGDTGEAEDFLVTYVTTDGKTIMLAAKLDYPHPKEHTVYSDNKMRGWTEDDCCLLGENATQRDAAHELLHTTTAGGLEHVVDGDNLMYENVDSTGTLLRYRPIKNPDGLPDQHQWSQMSITSF